MKKIGILLLFIWISQHTFAQSLTFKAVGQPEGIEGVVVSISGLHTGQEDILITNATGDIDVQPFAFPIVIQTRHLSYQVLLDTLHRKTDQLVFLTSLVTELDEVVVTGQFDPQAASNSVFKVKVIDEAYIKASGATVLGEVLASTLNVRLSQDLAIGSTTVSLQGISSQNIKVLMDGVPLVNRNGNGNAADLSQVNLNNIEKIEIVEGPMAVNYGANALAGVINLISKKEIDNQTVLKLSVQEESVGSAYGIDKGRHIQHLGIDHQFSDRWFGQLGLLRNDFQGFQGRLQGRQQEWNPKEQWQGNALLKFSPKNHQIYYRLDYLDEIITNPGASNNNFLPNGENQPFAIDETYKTNRAIHHVQLEGKLPFLNRYHAFFSFSDFERVKRRFSKNLVTGEENLTTTVGDQDISTYQVWELGGSFFKSIVANVDLQAGYQLTYEKVGGGRVLESSQSMNDWAIYASAEWTPAKAFTVRPGARFVNNNVYGAQLVPSLQAKYTLSDQALLRFSYGRGYRAPSVRELFFEFVDSNHRIFGNSSLKPEFSHHVSVNLTKAYKTEKVEAKTSINLFFNHIEDQIGLGQSVTDVTATTYINVDQFKTVGGTITQEWILRNFRVNAGFSYIGRYNKLNDTVNDGVQPFFFTPEFNANVNYQIAPIKTRVNVFYKYTGRLRNYLLSENEQGEQVINTGEIEGYHWLDLTVSKKLFKALGMTFGIRNLLDIQRINNTGTSGNAHSGGPTVPVSYGRSYFIKLNYNLKIK